MKLICGLISGEIELFKEIELMLDGLFGKVDYKSDLFDFDCTDYYTKEMGGNLKRKFLSFERRIDLEDTYKIKLETNALEERFSKYGKRRINIDPGYLDLSKLVLLSTKDYSHRIYLRQGVFAEVTLFYKDRTFNPWPWTYRDYKSPSYIEVFNSIREIHKEALNALTI